MDKNTKLVASTVGALAAGATAQANVIRTEVADITIQTNQYLYCNILGGTARFDPTGSPVAGDDLLLSFDSADSEKPRLATIGGSGASVYYDSTLGSSYVEYYGGNTVVSTNDGIASSGYLEDTGVGDWTGGKEGFLGFKLSGGENGWLRVDYDDTLNTLTLHNFAYESTPGASITTEAIPEPASLLYMLLTGGAALGVRRRLRR